MPYFKEEILVLVDNAVSAHKMENRPSLLVETSGLALRQKSPEMSWICREQLICFCIQVHLQFFHLSEIGFIVSHINLGHHFSIAVAKLCVYLRTLFLEKLSEDSIFTQNTLLDNLNIGLWLLQERNLLKKKFSQSH